MHCRCMLSGTGTEVTTMKKMKKVLMLILSLLLCRPGRDGMRGKEEQ